MAQKHLSQDLTTSKVNSLPKELRDIAESLIGDKFGYEEVVERYSSNPFSINVHTISGEDIRATPDFESRRVRFSTSVTSPTARAFRDAIFRLQRQGLRNTDAYLPPRFARELTLDSDFRQFAMVDDRQRGYTKHCIGQLFGTNIFVVDGVPPEVIAYT